MSISTLGVVDALKNKLEEILISNSYVNNLGLNVLVNERSFNFTDDIDKDTINLCDEGIYWEKENNYLFRQQNFIIQFYITSDTGIEFKNKIYSVYDDIEKFIKDLMNNSLASGIKIRNSKGALRYHKDGRELALVEIELTTALIA